MGCVHFSFALLSQNQTVSPEKFTNGRGLVRDYWKLFLICFNGIRTADFGVFQLKQPYFGNKMIIVIFSR